jgi:hypothetical protein
MAVSLSRFARIIIGKINFFAVKGGGVIKRIDVGEKSEHERAYNEWVRLEKKADALFSV